MRETWYVLEDGSSADPNEVGPDDAGVLRHKNGMAVAVGPHGPRSRGVDLDQVRPAQTVTTATTESPDQNDPEKPPAAADRQMKAASGAGKYKTR